MILLLPPEALLHSFSSDHKRRLDSTIGAGDTFIGGVLFGLVGHPGPWEAPKVLRFAVELATLKVQREGFRGLARDMEDCKQPSLHGCVNASQSRGEARDVEVGK